MRKARVKEDSVTMVALLMACADLGDLRLWRWIHARDWSRLLNGKNSRGGLNKKKSREVLQDGNQFRRSARWESIQACLPSGTTTTSADLVPGRRRRCCSGHMEQLVGASGRGHDGD